MKLYLLRHAESQSNENQVISCKLPGLGLSPRGLEQIKETAEDLKNLKSIVKIYCSPFLRTRETVRYLNLLVPVVIDERIKELDYGELEAVSEKEAAADLKRIMDLIYRGDYQVRFGSTGENQQELLSRIYEFLIELIKKEETALVVTHGCVISIIHRLYRQLNNLEEKIKSENAKLIEVDFKNDNLPLINNLLAEINNLK